MSSDEPTRSTGFTPTQESSLYELGGALISSGRLVLFAELVGGTYLECNYLRRGSEGAVILKLLPKTTLVFPDGRRFPAGGPELRPGETGWIGTGSNRFRVREAIVDHEQGVEFAIGYMEAGGFHTSKHNFDRRFRSDSDA